MNKTQESLKESSKTLFAKIRTDQYEKLRALSFKKRVSIASIVREAIDKFLKGKER